MPRVIAGEEAFLSCLSTHRLVTNDSKAPSCDETTPARICEVFAQKIF